MALLKGLLGAAAGFVVSGFNPLGAVAGYQAGEMLGAGDDARAQAESNARAEEEMARYREQQYRIGARRAQGLARARVGTSSVLLEGSPLGVLAEAARQEELEAMIIRRGGELASGAQRRAGRAAQSTARAEAFGGLLTAGLDIYQSRKTSLAKN
jgi:hypothetical protein